MLCTFYVTICKNDLITYYSYSNIFFSFSFDLGLILNNEVENF